VALRRSGCKGTEAQQRELEGDDGIGGPHSGMGLLQSPGCTVQWVGPYIPFYLFQVFSNI
jgi:hypothetical protein